MKRISLIALFALIAALVWPSSGRAQTIPTPPPTPTPNPMVYSDPGMNFQAPAGFIPVGQRHIAPADLNEDPTPLAAWIYPNRDHPRRLILEAESFDGSVSDFDSTYEQQMRSQFDGALFKNKRNFSFSNGMPAIFLEMTSGEGFNVQKLYIVIWADGTRGMALVLSAQLDDINDTQARAFLSDVTAVRYPIDRE